MSGYLTGLDKFHTCVLICMYINTVQVVLTTFINIILCKSIEDLTSLFMYQHHYLNNLPETFTNYFIKNNQIHQHNTTQHNTRNT